MVGVESVSHDSTPTLDRAGQGGGDVHRDSGDIEAGQSGHGALLRLSWSGAECREQGASDVADQAAWTGINEPDPGFRMVFCIRHPQVDQQRAADAGGDVPVETAFVACALEPQGHVFARS